jgi:hypothetical protein
MEALFIFGFPCAMVAFILWAKSKERMKRYEIQSDLYTKFLEKGETLPNDLFEPAYMKYAEKGVEKKNNEVKNKPLNVGIILLLAGIGIWTALTAMSVTIFVSMDDYSARALSVIIESLAATGFIPMSIGVAFIIIHFIQRKKNVVKDAE